jgi:hypothetical protein
MPYRDELARLRKGRGVSSPELPQMVGPALRRAWGIEEGESIGKVRIKVIRGLTDMASTLPPDLHLVTMVVFGLHPEAQERYVGQRRLWLVRRWNCDTRTVQRREDEALDLAVAHLTSPVASSAMTQSGAKYALTDWYLKSFRTVLRLDKPTPEASERREIVSLVNGLSDIVTTVAIPRAKMDMAVTHDLEVELDYGGHLYLNEHPTESFFCYYVRIPRSLDVGEAHEFGMTVRIPPDQPMLPHYVFTPLLRCDVFELRVKFAATHVPEHIWLVPGIPQKMSLDGEYRGHEIFADELGEVHKQFSDLHQGLGYGIWWE